MSEEEFLDYEEADETVDTKKGKASTKK